MKLVREYINEKFKEESDPIHDMNIGLPDIVYRCGECGSLCDNHNNILPEGEEFERAKKAIEIWGNKGDKIKYVWCNNCQEEEYRRQEQEEYEREMQREWERQQEEEERWRSEHEDGYRYY